MKIGLLLFKNVIGGVEIVSLNIANLLQEQGHEVFFIFPLIEIDKNIKKSNIPKDFKVYENKLKKSRITIQDMVGFISKTINEEFPDIIISMFLEESYILLKSKKYIKKDFKLIMMDHAGCCNNYKKFWQHRIIEIYNQSDYLVTITKMDEDFYKPKVNVSIKTITNLPGKDFYQEINSFQNNYRNKKILSLGRLVKNKGFDILIRSFSKVKQDGWTLHIYGDGPEKNSLKELIIKNKMEEKIFLLPATKDVAKIMNNHEIFVFPSLVESYGMVLLEALLMGLPSISFNCPNGPAIIESELPGSVILVPPQNELLLTSEINNLINNKNKRFELSILARKYRNIVNRENSANLWNNIFESVINNNKNS